MRDHHHRVEGAPIHGVVDKRLAHATVLVGDGHAAAAQPEKAVPVAGRDVLNNGEPYTRERWQRHEADEGNSDSGAQRESVAV